MKATIIGQDYIIVLEKEEFTSVRAGITLEAVLFGDSNSKLDKRVTLEVCDRADNFDGIDLIYLPEKRGGWADIKEVKIKVLPSALDEVESLGRFGTRYDGSNMIDIYNNKKVDIKIYKSDG